MAKLYPPQINGTIPAFYSDINQGTTKIVVPFSMNRAVSVSEIKGLMLKIRSLNGTQIGVVQSDLFDATANMTATFNLTSLRKFLNVGSYYKIQLAYIDSKTKEIGYYSTVGVVKYTILPKVEISGLIFSRINTHRYSYIGKYSQENGDPTEKLYSSRFVIYDGNDIFADSGEILHNNTNDESRDWAQEEYKINKELVVDKSYSICYTATSTNGLTVTSQRYRIVMRRSVDPNITAELIASLDYNNGYVLLSLKDEVDPIVSGQFVISRASNVNDWQWEKIKEFNLSSTQPQNFAFKDCTVEQGLVYKYSLQQYNDNGIYSSRILSNFIEVDFEDAFLFDGERQLRIRFNPKVTSFKTDLQESKTDTIGHQYPFFTRNSHVYYKEFPISGLISYLSDENELFMTKEELGLELITYSSLTENESGIVEDYWNRNRKQTKYNTTTDLTAKNISAERLFKMKVMEWLNDGKPKSFRSPGEGNYLVRLMNVSLSPNDSTGRMLHTFSCTAYEIADYNLVNLAFYGIYDPIKSISQQRRWVTVKIEEAIERAMYEENNLNPDLTLDQERYKNLKSTYQERLQDLIEKDNGWFTIIEGRGLPEIFIQDLLPGSRIRINGTEEIVIGATGSYRAKNELDPFTKVEINLKSITSGLLTYSFDAKASDVFGTIEEVVVEDVPCRQIIGNSYWKTKPIVNKKGEITGHQLINNVLDYLQNCKTTILRINLLKVTKRPIIDGFLNTSESLTAVRAMFRNYIVTNGQQNNVTNLTFNTADSDETFYLKNPKNDAEDSNYELPLYQLRMPRSDYRQGYSDYTVTNFEGDDKQYHYVYQNSKPYTFEQYYIDKHMDRFCPYTGYFYDPYTDSIIESTDQLFHFSIDGEDFNVEDIETWKVTDLKTKTESIIFNAGVIGELSYSKQTTTFEFDSLTTAEKGDTYQARLIYEDALAHYLIAREGRTSAYYSSSLLDYIEGYLPAAYLNIYKDKAYYEKEHGEIDPVAIGISPLEDIGDILNQSWTNEYVNSTVLSKDSPNGLNYRIKVNRLKDQLDTAYINYIRLLEKSIEEYRKENGIE